MIRWPMAAGGRIIAIGVIALPLVLGSVSCHNEVNQARPVDRQLEGLALIVDGAINWVHDGVVGILRGVADQATAVSYSLAGAYLVATCSGSDDGRAVAIPTARGLESRDVLRHPQFTLVDNVRYDETRDRVWFTYYGEPGPSLWTVLGRYSEPERVELAGSFGGSFDVAASDASTLVYIGAAQNPAEVVLRTDEGETGLPLALATAFGVAFSPDGRLICVSGSRRPEGDTALWVFSRDTGIVTKLGTTEGLVPTFPVFSPDGSIIAFRSFKDGNLWIVEVKAGSARSTSIAVDEAPLAW